jgi:pteridine reductase
MQGTVAGEGRVVLVTGAARRIGRVIAKSLHARGWNVGIHCSRSVDEACSLAVELNDIRPDSASVHVADLADLAALPKLMEGLVCRWGRLDALVNNASTFFPTPIGTATAAQWDSLFNANARGPFFLTQAAAERLAQARGSVVNIVDIYASRPQHDHVLYIMAKAALEAMTRALAVDLAPGVRVNAIAPGAVLWPESPSPYENQQALIDRTPLARCGTPADVAEAVAWLLESGAFMTGQVLTVDGGRSLPV